MHRPHWMQPRLAPVADIDSGRTDAHALLAVDAVAGRLALRAQFIRQARRTARLAAVIAISDVERVFVGQRRLDARPRAHIETDLLAHVAGERVGGESQNADPEIGDERRLAGGEMLHQRRRIGEIEHPGAAGPPRHHQPEKVLRGLAGVGLGGPFAAVALHVLAAVAFGEPLDGEEQIGPHRLRAEIAAPDPAGDRVHQEQHDRGHDQQAGDVIDLLRPDLDEEEIEPPVGEIDQHRLRGRVRTAIPAHERQQIIDAQGDQQHRPFDAAEGAVHALRINLAPWRIERGIVTGRLGAYFGRRYQSRQIGRRGRRLIERQGAHGLHNHFSPPPKL